MTTFELLLNEPMFLWVIITVTVVGCIGMFKILYDKVKQVNSEEESK